jgi:sulfide dehydrogenase cytochrome subunit
VLNRREDYLDIDMRCRIKIKNSRFAYSKRLVKYGFLLVCANLVLMLSANSEPLEELIDRCAMCHGKNGNSIAPVNPSIAGMTKEYFVHTLDAYKNNGRQSDMMKMFVHTLTEQQIDGLAEFYMKQTYIPRKQKYEEEKAIKGKALHDRYCEKCHENAGRITVNNYGFLAGQWTPYLKKAIQDYIDKKRNAPPMMMTKLKKMEEAHGKESIDLLLHYYASLQ